MRYELTSEHPVYSRSLMAVAAQLVRMILLPRQVKTMAMPSDNYNNTILVDAAMNKNADLFAAVLSRIEKDLNPQEVRTNDYLEKFVTCSRVGCTLDKPLVLKLE